MRIFDTDGIAARVSEPMKLSTDQQYCDVNGDIKTVYHYRQEIKMPEGQCLKRVVTLQGNTLEDLQREREKFLNRA